MARLLNTNAAGKPFDETIIEAVWRKATISSEHPPLRVDAYGALIWRGGYGNTNSKFGWEIGHKNPLSNGGSDDLENLQPLQWENNRHHGDN
jgi:5-methylcytosine-specific restriction endonuclease McrA